MNLFDIWDNEKSLIKLINDGADVNQKNNRGQSILAYLVSTADVKVIELLIKKGAIIDDSENNNRTALAIAVSGSKHKIVKVLLEAGANISLISLYDWKAADKKTLKEIKKFEASKKVGKFAKLLR